MTTPLADIQITDEFTDDESRFENYDAIPLNQRTQLKLQKHTDIRTFSPETVGVTPTMLHLDQLSFNVMDLLTIGQISSDGGARFILDEGEKWSAGTVAKQSDRNNWGGISLACTTGNTSITQSVMRS